MKKIKQIESYYCDYCDKEYEHTKYVVPSLKIVNHYIHDEFNIGHEIKICKTGEYKTEEIQPKQVDICPNCQDKIAVMLDDIIKKNNRKIIRKSEYCDFSRYY